MLNFTDAPEGATHKVINLREGNSYWVKAGIKPGYVTGNQDVEWKPFLGLGVHEMLLPIPHASVDYAMPPLGSLDKHERVVIGYKGNDIILHKPGNSWLHVIDKDEFTGWANGIRVSFQKWLNEHSISAAKFKELFIGEFKNESDTEHRG